MSVARFPTLAHLVFDPNEDMGWQSQGNCLGMNPDLFFPGKGSRLEIDQAKAVCNGRPPVDEDDAGIDPCPVKQQCLDYAMRTHQFWGVWGGLSQRQRERLGYPGAGTRLTGADIREIRRRHDAGQSQHSLAREYHKTQACIQGIVTHKTWRRIA